MLQEEEYTFVIVWDFESNPNRSCLNPSLQIGDLVARIPYLLFYITKDMRYSSRVNSMTQFVSQVFPPSSEYACSQRHELAVISDQMNLQ
jgi:hypothetical protein